MQDFEQTVLYDWDCPHNNCDGWLKIYIRKNDPNSRPVFVKCSNKESPTNPCASKSIISKIDNKMCPSCDRNIKMVILNYILYMVYYSNLLFIE